MERASEHSRRSPRDKGQMSTMQETRTSVLVSGFAKAASQSSVEDNNPATSGRGEALSAYSADARIGIRIGKVPNFQGKEVSVA